ncbi:MAG: helix-turn-helix domain-containing protein [Chloroflexi bacterium]|nr:helix-turn-helix domain-containing protein [Chloroflexota bacterium]
MVEHESSFADMSGAHDRVLHALMDAARALGACRSYSEITGRLLSIAMGAIRVADAGILYLLDEATGLLKAHSANGIDRALDDLTVRPDEGLVGRAFSTGEAGCYDSTTAIVEALGPPPHDVVSVIRQPAGVAPQPRSALVVPVKLAGQRVGVLVLTSAMVIFAPSDMSLLQSLADQAGMALHNARLLEKQAQQVTRLQQALLDAEVRGKRDLIDEMLAGKYRPDFERSARVLGIDPHTPVVCLWMDVDRFDHYLRTRALDEGGVSRLMQHLYKALNTIVRDHVRAATVSLKDDELIVFLPVASEDTLAAQKIAEQFQTWLGQTYPEMSVSIGISAVVRGLDALIEALEDLQRATALHQRNRRYGRIFFADRLGVDRLLLQFHDARLLLAFAESVLGRVEHDKTGEKDLLKTLAAYFENSRNIADTARVMHLHQNTVRYRLDRVKELVGTDDWLSVELAVRIYRLHRRL